MKKYRLDTVLYQIGKVIWIPVVIAGIWFANAGYSLIGDLFSCKFYQLCKFPCPGCGGTRAVYYLFSGQFLQSIIHHPAVVYGVLSYIHFMFLYLWRTDKKTGEGGKEIAVEYYIYVLIAIVLLQWMIKMIFHFIA